MTPTTIMTFNIKGSYYEDGANNWPHRAQLNSDTINTYQPDLIGFQEVQQGNIEHYAEHLPGYAYEQGAETARENNSGSHYYCAIYWKMERFDCLERGHFFLNETPDVYALDWGVQQGRTVNWVKLADKVTGRRLLHINTHLPHDSELGRTNSAHLIVRRLPELVSDIDSAILTADFNARASVLEPDWLARLSDQDREMVQGHVHWMYSTEVYDTFASAGFRDIYREAGHKDEPSANTFHALMGEQFPHIGMRIDWILIKDISGDPLRIRSVSIIKNAQPPLYPSDHYPVVAIVE